MSDMQSERLTIRISRELRKTLDLRAHEVRKDPSHIIREALTEYLKPAENARDAFARAGLIGAVKKAPRDLSTNKKYFEGFGRK